MITSLDNKRIKNVIQLLEKGKARKEQNAYVIEGTKLYKEADPSEIMEVYVSESYEGSVDTNAGYFVEKVSDDVFRKMTDTLTPQGILCVIRKKSYDLDKILEDNKGKAPLFILLDTLQDPGNLGTIMRTAEGAGVTAVIMNKETVDIYNPKTVRSTMGSIYRVPFIYTDIKEAITKLKKANVTCYAAHLKGEKTCYEQDYTTATCFFIGNEGNGLSDEIANMADVYIKIPMEGKLESLNAAVSAALLMYETKRQRG